ncbi:UNKNOWN [Stylonychia lemnae]|uniref:Uncharacterized protein n=1 Tax=Stylonychia lemnae TaxID=5949 RepID=A0A078AMS0_STYLE|nr:UNKNOWN [Stylonychia lemnae]|eukprot:CDW83216.1 UNKNOWN [Stylonychia lemnae]
MNDNSMIDEYYKITHDYDKFKPNVDEDNPLTDSFINEYLATGNLEPRDNLIQLGGSGRDSPFDYQNPTTNQTQNKSRNNNKLKGSKKQINAFMFNSSDAVTPSTTQINSRMGGSGSVSPAVTSYSNGASKQSLFHIENSQLLICKNNINNNDENDTQQIYLNKYIPAMQNPDEKSKKSSETLEKIQAQIRLKTQNSQITVENHLKFETQKQKLVPKLPLQNILALQIDNESKSQAKGFTFLGKFVKTHKFKDKGTKLQRVQNDSDIRKMILQEFNQRRHTQNQFQPSPPSHSQQFHVYKDIFKQAILKIALKAYHQFQNQQMWYFNSRSNSKELEQNVNISTLNDDIIINNNNKKVKVLNYLTQLPPTSTQHKSSKKFEFKIVKSRQYQQSNQLMGHNQTIQQDDHRQQVTQGTMTASNTITVPRGKRFEDFLPPQKRNHQGSKSKLRKIISNVKV